VKYSVTALGASPCGTRTHLLNGGARPAFPTKIVLPGKCTAAVRVLDVVLLVALFIDTSRFGPYLHQDWANEWSRPEGHR
jgi:hypothetical protein